jgi:hypothetical protein
LARVVSSSFATRVAKRSGGSLAAEYAGCFGAFSSALPLAPPQAVAVIAAAAASAPVTTPRACGTRDDHRNPLHIVNQLPP